MNITILFFIFSGKSLKFLPSQMIRVQHPITFKKAKMLNQFFSKCYNYSIPPLNFSDLDVQLKMILTVSCALEKK